VTPAPGSVFASPLRLPWPLSVLLP
jgi:hypothetical protein